ncbi:MAG: M28 family peptidase [Candidatus Eiseniibacteriota bacterium]|nr:MAG: M28 family peptidase [Candidatus Eisenbacteria bacterium]
MRYSGKSSLLKHNLVSCFLVTLCFSVCAPVWSACAGTSAPQSALFVSVQTLPAPDTSRLLSDIKYLASDELEGRGTGEKGGKLAADFIAGVFSDIGLRPGGDGGAYFQSFDATVGVSMGEENFLKISFPDGERTYVVEEDFVPFSFSSVGTISGPLAFAGYGISSDRYGYDDYSELDAKGKVMLVMRHEPQQQNDEGSFAGKQVTHYSDLRYKATNARDQGAAAIMMYTDPLSEPEEDQLMPLQSLEGAGDSGLPAIQIKRRIAEAILEAEGHESGELQLKLDSLLVPSSFDISSVQVSLGIDLTKERRNVPNVVGILEPQVSQVKEYVVVGAHFDHLGQGGQFSLTKEGGIHSGADDNASGTAGMLELARIFAARRELLKRGIIFVGFNAEELGVLGSTFYVDHPAVPLDRTVFMLNLDTVGRMKDNKVFAAGTGSSPILDGLVKRANAELSLSIESSESGFGPSDHYPFYGSDIPVLFFFTGAHGDYHKVSDDWDKVNVEGVASIVRLAALALSEVVFEETAIPFTRAAPDTSGPPGGEGYGPGRGARFGIVPDFGGEPGKGAKISGVSEGSPAEKAGLLSGDVIVEFDGKTVTGLHDLSFAIKDKKPGDEVEVVVMREGERLTFKAILDRRGGEKK